MLKRVDIEFICIRWSTDFQVVVPSLLEVLGFVSIFLYILSQKSVSFTLLVPNVRPFLNC